MKSLSSLQMTLMFLLVLGIGCVAGSVVRPAVTAAQSNPSQGIYQECISVTLYATSGRRMNSGTIPDTVRIPAGWHVVGGGGTQGGAIAVLCR